MNKLLSGSLAIFAGVLSTPAPGSLRAETAAPTAEYRQDSRYDRLMKFFSKYHCPIKDHAAVFLKTADANALDWRLLPSLVFLESAGGKTAPNNNPFGWQSGKAHFASITAAIQAVGYQLAHGRAYQLKNLDGLLATYNPAGNYALRVKNIMAQIAPAR